MEINAEDYSSFKMLGPEKVKAIMTLAHEIAGELRDIKTFKQMWEKANITHQSDSLLIKSNQP